MGRHSAPDDYDGEDSAGAVLSAPPPATPASRPRPGRHSRGDETPAPVEGLDVIETALAGAEDESNTAQIEPIVDPVLDQPVPDAETTQLPPVPAEVSTEAAAAPADESASSAGTDAPVEDKAAAKARRKQERAAAKQAKQAKQAAEAATRRPSPKPDGKVSDLVLLRTDSSARARVIAAVVAPFVLYVGVLLVIGAFDLRTALIWIWVPLISAGIVAGLILDLAHRAAAVRAVEALERRQTEDETAS